nr:glycosyltransferase [uncultured Schaedlerella sp.]
MNSYAPVVVFVYNRADVAEVTLNALDKCEESAESDLFIFADGAKDNSTIHTVEEVRECINNFKNLNHFRRVEIVAQKKNKGLAKSVIDGVTEIIKKYGRVIVVEDDCAVTASFLKFMNKSLDFYEEDMSIGSITGWSPRLKFPNGYNTDVFCVARSCSLCWATWKNRWETVDWEMKNYKDIRYDFGLIYRVNRTGSDRFYRLIRQMKYNVQSWSVRFGITLVLNGQNTIYPRYSYVQNIGNDDRGTHFSGEQLKGAFAVSFGDAIADPELERVTPVRFIERQFLKIYSGSLRHRVLRWLYVHGGERIADAMRKN